MRFVVLCIIAFVLSLATHGIQCNNLCLSHSNSPIDHYKNFINKLRETLTTGSEYGEEGIAMLQPSVPNSQRFHFTTLTNEEDESLILAIDVIDVSIAAYRSGDKSYFFPNAPQIASQILFTNTTQNIMDFHNTFLSIENAAGTTRSEAPLGEGPLDFAISNLFRHQSVPISFLVIIQMVVEAAKFKFIEQNVVNSIRDGNNFTPGLAILSLENNWSELSFQIQASRSLQGLFGNEVLLYNSNDEAIEVDSVQYPIVIANLAFTLYHCSRRSTRQISGRDEQRGLAVETDNNKFIRMPSSSSSVKGGQENPKCNTQTRTTRISGRDGFCVDVAGALDEDGSRVILYTCGEQVNQKWTFLQDNTIRSLGKCLASNTSKFGKSIVIYDCDKASWEEIEWEVTHYGRIINFYSDLALTANAATIGTNLTGEDNTFDATQAWRVGKYVEPFIVSIVGLKEMCLEATNDNTNMWLENCVKNKTEQSWALYSDRTIRVNNDRSLCITSSTDSSSKVIVIRSCNGSINQRWLFMAEGTILDIHYEMVMDVAQNDVYRKEIILYRATRQPNQQWVILY